MSKDKNYIEHRDRLLELAYNNVTNQTFFNKVLEAVFSDLSLYLWQTDEQGNLIKKENGNLKIDWMKAIFSLGRIIGALLALKKAHEIEQSR